MRTRFVGFFSLAVLLVSSVALAQPPERSDRGRGDRGGFGFAFGRGGGSPVMLLANPDVRKELELTDEQEQQLQTALESLRPQRPEGGRNFQDLSSEERQRLFAEMRERREQAAKEAQGKVDEILLPHQSDRLQQISIQVRGSSALADEQVAAKLELTEEQKQQIQEVLQSSMQQTQALFRGGAGGGDRNAVRTQMEQLRSETDEKLLAVLTDEQKTKFEELKGEPVEIDLRGGFGRGGGGERRGQRGGNQE